MSKRLPAGKRRCPRFSPSPAQLFLLRLGLTCLLIGSASGAQGEDANSNLEFYRKRILKNKQQHYDIIVPYLLNGEQWKPMKIFYSQTYPAMLKFLIQTESQQLVISLERNDGLFANNFTETHYLEDGTSVVLMRNDTLSLMLSCSKQTNASQSARSS